MMSRAENIVDIQKRTILCPRCEQEQAMRDFATLGMNPMYSGVLSPIYRCKQCNHLFAPRGAGLAVSA